MPSPRKKFTRYTKGRNQQVIIPKPLALDTSDATLKAFIANAAAGTIGIYDDSNNVISGAITSGQTFSVVLKMSDGSIRKTTPLKWSNVTASKKLYTAPVKAQSYLGWNKTTGAMNLLAVPAAGKFYEIAVIETTEGNQPFPTWNYEYVALPGDAEIDVIEGLVALINNTSNLIYKQNAPIVTAKVKAVATYSNYTTTGTYTVTNGSTLVALTATGTDPAVGDYISFEPAATPSNTVGDVYKVTAVVAGTSFTLNRPYSGATQTFIAAEASGTRVKKVATITATGIEFNGINNQENFKIVARQELKYALITNLAAYTYGVGLSEQIYELELEGNTFAGNTAGNTVYGNEGFGNPDRFGYLNGDAETYDTFMLIGNQTVTLTAMPGNPSLPIHIIIAVPKSAGGLTASLQTSFGV